MPALSVSVTRIRGRHCVSETSTAMEFFFSCGLQDTPDIWKGWALYDTSEKVEKKTWKSNTGFSSWFKTEKQINLSVTFVLFQSCQVLSTKPSLGCCLKEVQEGRFCILVKTYV